MKVFKNIFSFYFIMLTVPSREPRIVTEKFHDFINNLNIPGQVATFYSEDNDSSDSHEETEEIEDPVFQNLCNRIKERFPDAKFSICCFAKLLTRLRIKYYVLMIKSYIKISLKSRYIMRVLATQENLMIIF
jgi:hypothetical protein